MRSRPLGPTPVVGFASDPNGATKLGPSASFLRSHGPQWRAEITPERELPAARLTQAESWEGKKASQAGSIEPAVATSQRLV